MSNQWMSQAEIDILQEKVKSAKKSLEILNQFDRLVETIKFWRERSIKNNED